VPPEFFLLAVLFYFSGEKLSGADGIISSAIFILFFRLNDSPVRRIISAATTILKSLPKTFPVPPESVLLPSDY
jgi:hypothetical protein